MIRRRCSSRSLVRVGGLTVDDVTGRCSSRSLVLVGGS